jgi:hypothetical protein
MKSRIKHFWDLRCTFGYQYTGSVRKDWIFINGFYAEVGNTLFMYDFCGDILPAHTRHIAVGTYGHFEHDGWNPLISHIEDGLTTWTTVDL